MSDGGRYATNFKVAVNIHLVLQDKYWLIH